MCGETWKYVLKSKSCLSNAAFMHLISHIILTIIMRADISDEDISAIVLEEGMLPQFVGRFIIVFLQG